MKNSFKDHAKTCELGNSVKNLKEILELLRPRESPSDFSSYNEIRENIDEILEISSRFFLIPELREISRRFLRSYLENLLKISLIY